nr:uncharacterized protein LOC115266762 isoform X2 [Aedes albopictus]
MRVRHAEKGGKYHRRKESPRARVRCWRILGLATPNPGTLGRVRHAGESVANPHKGAVRGKQRGSNSWHPGRTGPSPLGGGRRLQSCRVSPAFRPLVPWRRVHQRLPSVDVPGVLMIVARGTCMLLRHGGRQSLSKDSRGCNGGHGRWSVVGPRRWVG